MPDDAQPTTQRTFTPSLWLVILVLMLAGAAAMVHYLRDNRRLSSVYQAAANLRSGVFIAQETFRSSAHNDVDSDQKGEYGHLGMLCGAIASWGTPSIRVGGLPPGELDLLGPQWASPDVPAEMPSVTDVIGTYRYASFLGAEFERDRTDWDDLPEAYERALNNAEIYYVVVAIPIEGFEGPVLVITNGGTVLGSPPDVTHHVPAGGDGPAIDAAFTEVLNASTNGWGCFDSPTAATTRDNRTPRWEPFDSQY